MADFFNSRVPLHPEDAKYWRGLADDSDRNVSQLFDAEMARLKLIAAAKNSVESRTGPVDQEQSLRYGMQYADANGVNGSTPQAANLQKSIGYMYSEPDSRNVYMQAALAPEQAFMHAAEALSGDKSLAERGSRLAMAIPGALFPEVGYPIQPAYDRMYESVGPIGGALIDFALMPGPGEALDVGRAAARAGGAAVDLARFGRGVPTHLTDQYGNTIRQLRNSPRVGVEYAR